MPLTSVRCASPFIFVPRTAAGKPFQLTKAAVLTPPSQKENCREIVHTM